MKPTTFNYADYAKMETEMDKRNEYINALKAERDQSRLDCAVAEANHMRTLERFLEAQERIDELQAENISLRAERDALAKSICVVSEPIETIQPRGITE